MQRERRRWLPDMQHRSCYGISTKEGIDSAGYITKRLTKMERIEGLVEGLGSNLENTLY